MLNKVIKVETELSSEYTKIKIIFEQNRLLSRVIRTFVDIFDENINSVEEDVKLEFEGYEQGVNLKHDGGHFATTLIIPNKPLRIFNRGIGFLYDAKGLQYKKLCLVDARDDTGIIDENVVPIVADYSTFVTQIKMRNPNHTGYTAYNEAQVYIKKTNLLGIFVSINRESDSFEELNVANIVSSPILCNH